MKKLFFSVMLVAAALVGCTSDNEVKPNAGEVGAGEKGFVGFSIQLPTTSGTRANDEFDDGEPVPAEYKVNNATLFLFAGNTEAEAKFVAAYPMNITSFDNEGTDTEQCTTEGIITSEISKPAETNLYAFVMLNHNELYSANSLNGTALTAGTTTFADFSKIELTKLGTEDNLLMTNAPVSNKTAGAAAPEEGAEITVLAKLDANKIYATRAKAQADPAGEVYVERAAAKITVSTSVNGNADSDEAAIQADANVKYSKASIKWAVNNVNEKYYNARQMKKEWLPLVADGSEGTVNESTKYRFASGAAIHEGVVRTYWAEDMNYDTNVQTFTANPTKDQIDNVASAGTSVYVTENTFDVAHQQDMYTTGLSVSATFNGGKDFYIASTYGDNNILQATDATRTGEKVQDYISKYLYNNNNDFKAWIDDKGTDAAQFSVTMTNDEVNGTASVTSVSGTEMPSSINAAYINSQIKFKYYAGGVAYYNVLIKHFGDSETPWDSELHKVNNIEGVYGTDPTTATANFLGRYGIVRNNWYMIDIKGISQIGDPIVVTPGDTPDDKVKNYISVKIHILPWAVRKQSVIL